MTRSKLGLSLIEIIVVIAILLVLTAILLPIFSKATGRAKDTACIRNLQQIYAAYQLYLADNDEIWPVVQPNHEPILAYTKGVVFTCWACKTLHPDFPSNVPHYGYVGATAPNRDLRLRKARADCELSRGPQLPVLVDLNHRGDKARIAFGEEWVFVTRKNGSTTRVKPLKRTSSRGFDGDLPCEPILEALNY